MNQLYFVEKAALGASVLLVVVILLYLLRMPRQRIVIPALDYLQNLQVDAQRRRRHIRWLLSLALQVAILGLLVGSAARPLLSSGKLQERRILLLMDTSASMRATDGGDGRSRFEAARQKAREIIRRMEHGDRMLIVAADTDARIVQPLEKDRRTLYRALDTLQPGFQGTDLSPAFRLAREVIRPLAAPQIHLLSDGACEVPPGDYADVLSNTRLHLVGTARNNVGVVRFAARRNMDSERDFSSLISIRNTFDEPRRAAVRLTIGDKTVDLREITLPPAAVHTEMYEKTLLVGGPYKAELTLLDEGVMDPFPLDNVAWEWIPKQERIRVLVVTPPDEVGGYLDAAMSANIGVQGYRITPDKYHVDYDVGAMIFYNWRPEQWPECHVIFVNTRGDNPAAEVAPDPVLRPLMRTWDRTHPLMNYITLENLLLEETLRIRGREWMEPVATTVQTPLILAGRRGSRKMVFVAFDPRHSDFPFRLAFPVLISNSLLWFTQEETEGRETQARPGEIVPIRVPDNIQKQVTSITVVDPLHQKTQIEVMNGVAHFGQTHLCGTYTYALGRTEQGFAVQLGRPEESDIATRAGFSQAFSPEPTDQEETPVVERELWFAMNWLILGLLCVEAYLFHQRILF